MRLEKASTKAIRYACLNFHYAKSIPVNTTGFSVFNDKKEWCGVILFGSGANNNLANEYDLNQGEVVELVRIALNGKHESTSKALSISLKLIKNQLPLCLLIISYADKDKNHLGVIYQATNFYYVGTSMQNTPDSSWIIKGKRYHGRIISDWVKGKGGLNGLSRSEFLKRFYDINATEYITKGKYKYIYPLHKSLIPLCKSLSKPYPKPQAGLPHKGEGQSIQIAGAFDSTIPLNINEITVK